MTSHRPHTEQEPPARADLLLAWQRAKARWSSDPTDPDAYTAFIRAGTALYRHPPPAATAPGTTPPPPRGTHRPAYLRMSPLAGPPQHP
ncbi:hypothetical protein AB0D08_12025 [Kitasatospora sp. NPDC048540]|uniref:hypothetical protein n=1 Tax=unclassified Kitasatospora TaxID=2633591 RepID=UPI0009E847B2|nr:hypothetical protein [Kitasatospora sp. MBT63]